MLEFSFHVKDKLIIGINKHINIFFEGILTFQFVILSNRIIQVETAILMVGKFFQ
jgi:hypothetical protein